MALIYHAYSIIFCSERILVNCVPQFDRHRKDIVWHIEHEKHKEMSAKSVIVSILVAQTSIHAHANVCVYMYMHPIGLSDYIHP